ncbi:TraR/DksA family transcriptional regulator [Roseovarius sp. SYSU LYC5161]|jgi:DnaK suppressor protein|uniref:TraR/DksA family transcriptional regulator n=1 Tax=Roseovarius halophilus (ex Wu et al. 2025) TaxID=3376060 RepID=UPI002871F917|nr:TraR/DksA C4-type zinc finger protein [Roseovarius sp.]
MSDKNNATLQEMRTLIEARLQQLAEEDDRGEAAQATVELDQQAVGRLSRMDALQNQAMAKAGHARRQAEKTRLTAALKRMDAGEYGYCEDCGEEIARGRLGLDPAATRCVSCASG